MAGKTIIKKSQDIVDDNREINREDVLAEVLSAFENIQEGEILVWRIHWEE